ncbi:conserved fungal protein [Schizosaccharomyces pombe]|uniref:UPF0768 protein PB2B2.18 n=1 Tax=Schizosaccharomyces pombe (strain 972 / ATCC 24843) TaxID=284812 RepID=YHEI_SCHPO|nr:uncharacterized protein SPBPB2B2.18 [Schizosaccharomyces pombe]Q9HDT9.2 RecName: Full=UPF0768 protein PB2B2.18 [Schizosaccharomyces pombe 972h-]CAC21420.2 sequence orphan [Schizosaccharomyces pombe]|eukprot:NP_596864.2 uncharacterized protein SPBPB2B2.18 [Schizosaccharomyces pombe]
MLFFFFSSKKTVRVCRQLKTVTVLIVPVLPVYTNKVLCCSQCDWHEPANVYSIEQRRSHDDDLPTIKGSDASTQQYERKTYITDASPESQNLFLSKSKEEGVIFLCIQIKKLLGKWESKLKIIKFNKLAKYVYEGNQFFLFIFFLSICQIRNF